MEFKMSISKLQTIILVLFITASVAFATENWQKIGDNFYVDINSID